MTQLDKYCPQNGDIIQRIREGIKEIYAYIPKDGFQKYRKVLRPREQIVARKSSNNFCGAIGCLTRLTITCPIFQTTMTVSWALRTRDFRFFRMLDEAGVATNTLKSQLSDLNFKYVNPADFTNAACASLREDLARIGEKKLGSRDKCFMRLVPVVARHQVQWRDRSWRYYRRASFGCRYTDRNGKRASLAEIAGMLRVTLPKDWTDSEGRLPLFRIRRFPKPDSRGKWQAEGEFYYEGFWRQYVLTM